MEPDTIDETMPARLPELGSYSFEALTVNALYTGSDRGLQADILATRALGGSATTICTAMVMASSSRVTDVVDVPSDTVDAQFEHVFATSDPDGIKIGIVPHPHTIASIFEHLETRSLPVLMDTTAHGPTGETLLTRRGIETILDHLGQVDLVTARRTDAELLVEMEINSLDDAQVAAQRFAQRGAPAVLLRCGRIKRQHFEDDDTAPDFAVDLYYDGAEFGVFEAPYLEQATGRGASSALSMAILRGMMREDDLVETLQSAKLYVTQALRYARTIGSERRPDYFWPLANESSSSSESHE